MRTMRFVSFGIWLMLVLILLFWVAPFARAQGTISGSPIQGVAQFRSTVNRSAVITTGNTFQTILAAETLNSRRQSLTIQNNNATDSCWLFIGAGIPTKATSMLLLAGGSYQRYWPYVPSDAIQATCATSSDTVYVDVQ